MKRTWLLIFVCFMPLWLMAQSHLEKGDAAYRAKQYNEAIRKYKAAKLDGADVTQKIKNAESCIDFEAQLEKAKTDEAKLEIYEKLQALNPVYGPEIKTIKDHQAEVKRKQKEAEEAAQRAEEERRAQEQRDRERAAEQRRLKEEGDAWTNAKKTNTIDSYNAFLKKYPKSAHRAEAEQLRAEKQDLKNWQDAVYANTIAAYEKYLKTGGNYLTDARRKLDILYFKEAQRVDTETAYTEYLNRPYLEKAYKQEATNRKNVLERQRWLIAAAENAKNDKEAYEKIQAAKSAGYLSAGMKDKALRLAEPYAYEKVKTKGTLEERQAYLREYDKYAPAEHKATIRKKVSSQAKKQQAKDNRTYTTSSSKSYTTSNTKTYTTGKSTTYTTTYKKPKEETYEIKRISSPSWDLNTYWDNNGLIQYTWFSAEAFLGSSFGGALSVFEWRFGVFELSPIVFGYNYPAPSIMMSNNPTTQAVFAHSAEAFYYQPTARFYFPISGSANSAITVAGAPVIRFEEKMWFMAEVGYNFNMGRWNLNGFFRYNGDFTLGFQFKFCHVFERK